MSVTIKKDAYLVKELRRRTTVCNPTKVNPDKTFVDDARRTTRTDPDSATQEKRTPGRTVSQK